MWSFNLSLTIKYLITINHCIEFNTRPLIQDFLDSVTNHTFDPGQTTSVVLLPCVIRTETTEKGEWTVKNSLWLKLRLLDLVDGVILSCVILMLSDQPFQNGITGWSSERGCNQLVSKSFLVILYHKTNNYCLTRA